MTDFNAIGRPQLAAGVPRMFGVDMPRVSVVSSEIVQTVSPFELPEIWALMGGGLAMGRFEQNAGTYPLVGLFNPVNSGVLAVVEEVWMSNQNGAAAIGEIMLLKGQMSGSTSNWQNRDTRRVVGTQASGALACQMQYDNGFVAGWGTLARFSIPANETAYQRGIDIVLSPGWLLMTRFIVASTLVTTFVGRERPAADVELLNL